MLSSGEGEALAAHARRFKADWTSSTLLKAHTFRSVRGIIELSQTEFNVWVRLHVFVFRFQLVVTWAVSTGVYLNTFTLREHHEANKVKIHISKIFYII